MVAVFICEKPAKSKRHRYTTLPFNQSSPTKRHLASDCLAAEEVPARRHLERLADLRLAVERRVAELPALMVRRAKAEGARTSVSQVLRLPINPKKKVEH
jgi:hypothetical protein